jgi:pimeloyl-ACP methyl ester carboxylesterase
VEVRVARVAVAEGVYLNVQRRDGEGNGDGVAFLLVHGLASNLHLWDEVAAYLAAWGHAVAALDQRGHGRSDKPEAGYDFPTFTQDLSRVVEVLGFDRPVLVGQSWGANVVLEAAWRFPNLARGVTCIDGGWIELQRDFPNWTDCVEVLAPPALAGRRLSEIEALLRSHHPDWSDPGIAGALACFEHLADGTVAPWLSLEHHLAILQALWEHRPSSRYGEIEVPVLLVPAQPGSSAGSSDDAEDRRPQVEQAAAALSRGRLHWMRGDHDLHAHHPEEVASLLHHTVVDGFFG